MRIDPEVVKFVFMLVVVLALIGWGITVSIRARRNRKRRNHCSKCGYDLAGLDVNAACPECGEMKPEVAP